MFEHHLVPCRSGVCHRPRTIHHPLHPARSLIAKLAASGLARTMAARYPCYRSKRWCTSSRTSSPGFICTVPRPAHLHCFRSTAAFGVHSPRTPCRECTKRVHRICRRTRALVMHCKCSFLRCTGKSTFNRCVHLQLRRSIRHSLRRTCSMDFCGAF